MSGELAHGSRLDTVAASQVSPTSEFTCLLDYYASRHAYRYLLQACSQTLSTASGHPEARFYRAFGLIQENNISEGIRELESLIREQSASNGEYTLAATAALIQAHKQPSSSTSRRIDRESIEKYKEQLKTLSRTNDGPTLLCAGRYFLHTHKDKQAKQCLEKFLMKSSHHPTANIYIATIYRRTANTRNERKAIKICETVMNNMPQDKCDINALLCHTALMITMSNYTAALHNLNLIIVHYPSFLPALQFKSTLLFLIQEYEESLVLSYRIIKKDHHYLFALYQIVLYFLVKEGGYSISAKERMNDFLAALQQQQGTNTSANNTAGSNSNTSVVLSFDNKEYYYHCSRIIARLAYKNKAILLQSISMLETIIKQSQNTSSNNSNSNTEEDGGNSSSSINSNIALYVIEQAYQYYLIDDYVTAHTLYTQAAKLEEHHHNTSNDSNSGDTAGGHIYALIGKIKIKIKQQKYKEAEQELEFLSDLTGHHIFDRHRSITSSSHSHSNSTSRNSNNDSNDTTNEDNNNSVDSMDSSKLEVLLLRANLAYYYHQDYNECIHIIQSWFNYYQQYCNPNLNTITTHIEGNKKRNSISAPISCLHYDDLYPYHYLLNIHADLIMELMELIILILPSEPKQSSDPDHILLLPSLSILSLLLTIIPGHVTAYIYYSKLLFLYGDFMTSESILIQKCLALDPTNAYIHLQLSYIYYYTENYKACSNNIEQARALDFDIRNTVHYYLMKAKLLRVSGNEGDAIKVLLAAMELPGVKKVNKRLSGGNTNRPISAASQQQKEGGSHHKNVFPLSSGDRLSIYLELSSAYASLGNMVDAAKIMSTAKLEFGTISSSSANTNTNDENKHLYQSVDSSRVLIAEAELALKRKDYDLALSLYRLIDSDNLYYTRCKIKMSEIYLTVKKNKKAYINCYQDLILLFPTVHHYILLAEAYLQIQDPDDAINAYEKALSMIQNKTAATQQQTTTNAAVDKQEQDQQMISDIYSRIGKALIATHDYNRAVQYYEHAVAEEERREAEAASNNNSITNTAASTTGAQGDDPHTVCKLLHELATLYNKMRKYDDSIAVIHRCLAVTQEKRNKLHQTAGTATTTTTSSDDANNSSSSSSSSPVAPTSTPTSYADALLVQWDIKSYTLLSTIAKAREQPDEVLSHLHQAYNLQSDLLSLLTALSSTLSFISQLLLTEKEHQATLCYQLASYYHHTVNNTEQSILYYHESLKHNPIYVSSLLALSQLFFAQGEYDQAQQTLLSLLRLQNNDNNPIGTNKDNKTNTTSTSPKSKTNSMTVTNSNNNNGMVTAVQYRTASLLLAEIMYEKGEYDNAIYHFTNLLEAHSMEARLEALVKMIKILRRAGRLSEAMKYIKICERAIANGVFDDNSKTSTAAKNPPSKDNKPTSNNNKDTKEPVEEHIHYATAPGLHYCKGLYYYYCNQPRDALVELNYARKDNIWGKLALIHMIEIYLNPDHDDLFVDVHEQQTNSGNTQKSTSHEENPHLQAAQKLLSELYNMGEKSWRYTILECYILLATKLPANCEKVIHLCTQILNQDNNYIPALLCLANTYHVMNNPTKTRNYLKRISKQNNIPMYHDYLYEFEQSYLFLAEIYHQLGKFELSTELCKKVLLVNKSNSKAWEILAGMHEKEAAYRDAAEHYEMAWKNSGSKNINIGYKLAFNYLKCKKYVECLDVCQLLLKQNPELPKIRKEIIEKARNGLRP